MAHDLGRRPDDAADEMANGDGKSAIGGRRQGQGAEGTEADRLLRGQRVIGIHSRTLRNSSHSFALTIGSSIARAK